jgi:hypothetical protein
MESFQIAHLNLPGPNGPVNVIVVFLNTTFDQKTEQEKNKIQLALQVCARSAELAGNVVPVWLDSAGNTKFIAPQQQHPFFTTTSYVQLYGEVNKTLTCGT